LSWNNFFKQELAYAVPGGTGWFIASFDWNGKNDEIVMFDFNVVL